MLYDVIGSDDYVKVFIQTGDLVKALTVNASAAEIIRLYCGGLDIDAIADSLHQKYGVPEEQVHADVEALLKKLE